MNAEGILNLLAEQHAKIEELNDRLHRMNDDCERYREWWYRASNELEELKRNVTNEEV